jgi:hypothetical protein
LRKHPFFVRFNTPEEATAVLELLVYEQPVPSFVSVDNALRRAGIQRPERIEPDKRAAGLLSLDRVDEEADLQGEIL